MSNIVPGAQGRGSCLRVVEVMRVVYGSLWSRRPNLVRSIYLKGEVFADHDSRYLKLEVVAPRNAINYSTAREDS